MVDVLLIQPPIRDFYLTAKRTIPYGLASIASALIREGFSVEIFDALATSKSRILPWPEEMGYLEAFYGEPDLSPFGLFHHYRHYGYSFEHLGQVARRSGAFLVGISSLFTAYSGEALQAANVVKAALPQSAVVLGGHHPTQLAEQAMECRAVDYAIRGEGEIGMPALARALREGSSLEAVPGIVYRRPDGSLTISPPAAMADLDAAPLPALHLVNQRFYRRGKRGSSVVVASRGCPLQCSYCSMGASSSVRYRQKRVASVLSEIEEAVQRYGAGFIDFEDENISLNRAWFLELLQGIRDRFGPCGLELRAMNGLYPPTLDDEVIEAMQKAGFKTLNLSLGTTSPTQLKRFRRPDVGKSFDAALACAARNGMEAVGYVIVAAPGQDPNDSLEDLLFLASRPVLAGVSVFYPSPGSVDFASCAQTGLLPAHLSLMRSTALPVCDTTTRQEAVTLLRLSRLLNFIKLIRARQDPLPPPSAPESAAPEAVADRYGLGRLLLAGFLQDGKLRGIRPEGSLFEHKTSRALCTRFQEGILPLLFAPTPGAEPDFGGGLECSAPKAQDRSRSVAKNPPFS